MNAFVKREMYRRMAIEKIIYLFTIIQKSISKTIIFLAKPLHFDQSVCIGFYGQSKLHIKRIFQYTMHVMKILPMMDEQVQNAY